MAGGYFIYLKPLAKTELDPLVQKIVASGKLVVGTDPTYPPMEDKNGKGEVVGFDVDLARAVAEKLGVKLEIKAVVFDDLLKEVEEGKVDLGISSITITPERAKGVDFSNPYLNAGQTVVVAAENTEIGRVKTLTTKRRRRKRGRRVRRKR